MTGSKRLKSLEINMYVTFSFCNINTLGSFVFLISMTCPLYPGPNLVLRKLQMVSGVFHAFS